MWTRILFAAVVLGGTLTAQAGFQPRAEDAGAAQAAPLIPRVRSARLAALGFDGLMADYYWLRAVQIVGAERRSMTPHEPVLGALSTVVVGLDPWVDHPYRFAGLWLQSTPESVRLANRILERGIAYHPDEWRNRFYLSFNHFFYFADVEAAARELERAVDLPGAPAYLGRLLARLRSESAGLDVAQAYLEELLRQAEDPHRREQYELAIQEIEIERAARVLDQAREAHRARHGRDIERVEDLAAGPDPVLRRIPPAPDGSRWLVDPRTGTIVSGALGRRYQVYIHPSDQERRAAWARDQRARRDGVGGGS